MELTWKWYQVGLDGMVNPLVFMLAGGIIGLLWGWRVLSTRSMLLGVWSVLLTMCVHGDYMFNVSGFRGLFQPVSDLTDVLVRAPLYGAVSAFMLWGGWGWIKLKVGPEKLALSRGLPYLKERWRERKEKRG